MNAPTLKVFFVYEGSKFLVQLPKHIDYGSLVRCARKKFKLTGKSSLIVLSCKIDRNKVSITDDDEVVYFFNEVFESRMKICILISEHKWKNNTFKYMLVPPNPPSVIKNPKNQPFFTSRVLKVFDEFEDMDECIREIALKCLKEVREANIFRITYMNDFHTCSKITVNGNHSNATAKVLGHMLVSKTRDITRVYKPKDIQLDMNLALNIDISYKKAWRGKQLALQATQGCPKASYEQLPYYFHYLKLVRSFLCFMHPLLIIDAAHLKGRYLGTNLAVVAMDGNNQIIPIATGVTHGETGESWTWFLSKLKECIGEVPGLAIISDRHFAMALHGLYWKTCKAYTRAEFDKAYCPANRYNYMTSNSVESINLLTREVRKVPITMLMDWYRQLLQQWYCDRRSKYEDALDKEVSDWATAKIYDRILKSVNWTVKGIHKMNKYEVKDNQRGHIVDLTEGTCSCRKWQLSGLPFGHVCAVARVTGLTSVEGLVQTWFFRTTLKNTYSGVFNPTQDVATWETRDDLQVVLAPVIIKRQAGRPKNKDRIRSQGEEHVKKQCTRCGANVHTRGSCNVPLVTKKRCATRKMRSLRALCRVPRIANGKPRSSTRNENLNNATHPESTNQQSMNVPTPPASIGMINRLSQMSTPQNFLV
ncbi:transposase, MuDR, MULE transposase domain protein [Artemisia annua]|uniref:Transposase, MuDR, MULE transposase domain protein n=1 Tax=Artemisia annua TaxID=35608 RepID=A0A2U1MNA7_ARTAN|nr:transposase, MuDR, MULE transposase domain protein [Artemisia annua]